MTSLIQKIGKLAIQTFRRDQSLTKSTFNTKYAELSVLVNDLTSQEVNLSDELVADSGKDFTAGRDGAPVIYMQLYEDLDVNICMFILKRGVRLPLHDHPGMYGLLKVVHGKVAIQSYSITGSKADPKHLESASIMPAKKHTVEYITAEDNVCLLTPENQNLHSISAVDGPAAFLDILAPPYGSERDCHYFQEVESSDIIPELEGSNIVFLAKIPSPSDFWCDQADYKGPHLDASVLHHNGS
ncbi:unnamed protein product [Meganyctiphanes norvegica]|uniref:2-aminoethanethiol dioxygenase n=1 Tax=Meganyctiphanes norvegica TaxID=48144 RepID=A0AAV2SRH1_MEGNR